MRVGVTLAALIAMTSTALAGGGFDIVVPYRHGVPIIINGIDASYAVIEGEWGLGKNVQVQPTSMAAATSIPIRMSVIIIRAWATCPATGAWRSSRRRTAACRGRPRVSTNPGPRNRCRCRRNPIRPSIRRR